MKYIDAEKLIAEIERRIQHAKENPKRYPDATSSIWSLQGILSFIDSLQQEQPEVDLEKEIDKYLMPIHAWQIQEAPFSSMENIARYFYELGLNARKEE